MNARHLPDVAEHRYYVAMATGVAVIIVAGFTPNYARRILHDHRYLTLLVHLHGLVMASWIALFVTQVTLAARHRIDLHRRVGTIGAWLIIPMLALGTAVLVNAATRKAHGDEFACLLMLVGFDGLNLFLFAGFAVCAVLLRHRGDYHKRLMLLATLSLLGPAFGRLIEYANVFDLTNALAVLVLMLACVSASVSIDVWRQHRLHPVFAWGGSSLVAADVLTCLANLLLWHLHE